MKDFFSFVDSELLMMIGIVIMSIILIRIIFKTLYRFRFLKIILAILIFGGLTFMAVNYVNNHKYLFSKDTSFYVYGKAGLVSNSIRTIDLDSNKTNFAQGGKGRIIVKVPRGTKIVSSENKNKQIKLDDIKSGEVLQIFCEKNYTINGNEVTELVWII